MPGLLPTDGNGSFAAVDTPPNPMETVMASMQPPAPPQSAAPPPSAAPAPPAPGAPPPAQPDEMQVLMQRLEDNAKRRKAVQDQLAAATGPDGVRSKLPNGGKAKPSDMLADALYNISQLNLRNPSFGVLKGEPYTPIQQQRLEQALKLNQADVQNLSTMEKSMADQASSDQFQLNQKRLEAQMKQQASVEAQKSQDREAAIAQRAAASKAANAFNYAKMLALQPGIDATADLHKAQTMILDLGKGDPLLAAQTWGESMGYGPTDQKVIEMARELALAKQPMAGAVTNRTTTVPKQVPDPDNPGMMKTVYDTSVSTSSRTPQPLNIGLPGQNLNTTDIQPVPGPKSTPAPIARPTNVAPPAPSASGQRVNPKAIPSVQQQDKATKEVNQLDIATTTVKQLYNGLDANRGMLTSVESYLASHPDTPTGQIGSALVSNLFHLNPDQAKYVANWMGLKEYVNLLRNATGATAFRGPQGWNAMQSLLGNPNADPALLKASWQNVMRDFLAQRAASYKTMVSGTGGVYAPDKDTIEAYVLANGGSYENAEKMIKKHGYTGRNIYGGK